MNTPGPASDVDAALEASIRLKFRTHTRLTDEERAYLGRRPDGTVYYDQ